MSSANAVVVEGRTQASALDQHWTPPEMVQILAEHLAGRPLLGDCLVEPFAGAGRIIAGISKVQPQPWRAIEIDPQYRAPLMRFALRSIVIGDAFLVPDWGGSIVTNPPFGPSLTRVLKRVLHGFELGREAAILCVHRSLVERRWMPAPSEALHPRFRVSFGGAKGGLPGTCWAIWRPGHVGATEAHYCEHPETRAQGVML